MTAEELARLMRQRAGRCVTEVDRATRRIAVSGTALSKKLMTAQIYSKPEDRRKNGKKVWSRTGALRQAEVATIPAPGVVTMVNRMKYARPRHDLDYSGLKKARPYVDRTAHWRTDLLREFAPQLREIQAEMVMRILRG